MRLGVRADTTSGPHSDNLTTKNRIVSTLRIRTALAVFLVSIATNGMVTLAAVWPWSVYQNSSKALGTCSMRLRCALQLGHGASQDRVS